MTGDDDTTIERPLAGDPAVRWRTMRDLFERRKDGREELRQ